MALANYTKVGEAWGIKGAGEVPAVGDQVEVQKRDGTVNVEVVEAVVATGLRAWPNREDGWVATIQPRKRKAEAPANRRTEALTGIMKMLGGMSEDALVAIHNQIAVATGGKEIN